MQPTFELNKQQRKALWKQTVWVPLIRATSSLRPPSVSTTDIIVNIHIKWFV